MPRTAFRGTALFLAALLLMSGCARRNVAPQASFTINPAQGDTTTTFVFDAGASSDPDGEIQSYAWVLGDGTSANGPTVEHSYSGTGTYTVVLTVTDNDGATASSEQTLDVASAAPSAAFTASPQRGYTTTAFVFNAGASTDSDGTISTYSWTFGDGTTALGALVSHSYSALGTYTVTLTVTDNDANSVTTSKQVEVVNAEPTPNFTVQQGVASTDYTFTASSSSDLDGVITGYNWDFGDGTNGSGEVVSHSYAAPGQYDVTLTVTDDRGAQASHTVTVYTDPTTTVATLSGVVVNRKAGTAVAGTTVTIEGTGLTTTTDADGFYRFPLNASGSYTLVFTQAGYAETRVEGVLVNAADDIRFDTIQAEAYDPALPVSAPSLALNVNNGALLLGDATTDIFTVSLSGTTVSPADNGFYFASVGLATSKGSSGYLNGYIPGASLFSFDGTSTDVELAATGFDGPTTLHAVAYDQNSNRIEIIRQVTVESAFPGLNPVSSVYNVRGNAITFGDTSVFGTLSAGVSAADLMSAVEKGDVQALKQQADLRVQTESGGLATQSFLDEVVTWVDLEFDYVFDLTGTGDDLPTGFEVFRRLKGEADFQLIGRLSPLDAYIGGNEGYTFAYRDSTPAVQAGLEVSYRIDAVTGTTRTSSTNIFTLVPLGPFSVTADAPGDGDYATSVIPTYRMSFSGGADDVFVGVIVLDRTQASGNFAEWLTVGFSLADAAALASVGGEISLSGAAIPHNITGTASLPYLQAYHAYDWQPVAVTTTADGSAISVAADFYDFFELGFGVQDTPINTFVTGDGTY